MRRAFSDTLLRSAREDDRLIFLTGDLGFQVFDAFVAEFPDRYVNVGVAEATLVDCAAGLALEGWRPVVYSIASFLTGRAFEQLRLSVGYHGLPVMVVGAGGGYLYAGSGVTHHAKEDVALMSLVAGMTVTVPGDPNEVAELMPRLLASGGPSYMRIGRFGEPRFVSDAPIVPGVGRLVRDGEKVCVVTAGSAVIQALEAVDMLAGEGLRPMLAHFHTVRPLDVGLLDRVSGRADRLLVVEDHGLQGGLYAAVAAWAMSSSRRVRVDRLGPDDELLLGNPHGEDVGRLFGSDRDGVAARIRELSALG